MLGADSVCWSISRSAAPEREQAVIFSILYCAFCQITSSCYTPERPKYPQTKHNPIFSC